MKLNLSLKQRKAGFIIFFLLTATVIGVGGYSWYQDQHNLMVITQKTMDGIPMHCYEYFNDKSTNASNSDMTFYPEVINSLNKTGMHNLFPFIRSASFHLYMFENCPYLNYTKYGGLPKDFNATWGTQDIRIQPTPYLVSQQQREQNMFEYDFASNKLNFNRIEYIGNQFGLTLPQVTDNLLLSNSLNFTACVNPSWKANSTVRQCNFEDSHFDLDKNTQALIGILDPPPVANTQNRA